MQRERVQREREQREQREQRERVQREWVQRGWERLKRECGPGGEGAGAFCRCVRGGGLLAVGAIAGTGGLLLERGWAGSALGGRGGAGLTIGGAAASVALGLGRNGPGLFAALDATEALADGEGSASATPTSSGGGEAGR